MKITPYLSFDGQCQSALDLYARCLGGTVVYSTTYGESPGAADLPPEWSARVYHATLVVGGQTIGLADAPPGSYQQPQGFSLMLEIDEPAEADRVFEALSVGGTIEMPIQETHWAARFGVVTDQFGTPWIINCGTPA